MKFREFVRWCNERACDGAWSLAQATFFCILIQEVKQHPFWRRKKVWERICAEQEIPAMIQCIDQARVTAQGDSRVKKRGSGE